MWLYIYFRNTPKIQAILEKRWGGGGGGERDRKSERAREREGKRERGGIVPNIPQMFLQTIFDPQGTERKKVTSLSS